MQDVEPAEQPLGRRRTGTAPQRPQGVCTRDDGQPALDLDACKRRLDLALSACAHRRERDERVLARRGLDQPEEGAAHVVAHARQLVRQGRNVDDDPHGWGEY